MVSWKRLFAFEAYIVNSLAGGIRAVVAEPNASVPIKTIVFNKRALKRLETPTASEKRLYYRNRSFDAVRDELCSA